MKIIEECFFENQLETHKDNINQVKIEIDRLSQKHFQSCIKYVRKVIITTDVDKTLRKHRYEGLNKNAWATTCKIDNDLYDIVINYFKNVFLGKDKKWRLDKNIKNTLYHELQHIKDHKQYDIAIAKHIVEYDIGVDQGSIGKMMFFELNAAYHAQKYFQMLWTENKYAVQSNSEKYHKKFVIIKKHIQDLNLDNIEITEKKVEELKEEVLIFVKSLMYNFSLSFGTNAADNKISCEKKMIDIYVSGIDNNIDFFLNSLISDINTVLYDEKETMKFLLSNCMIVFDYINGLFKQKIKELQLNN